MVFSRSCSSGAGWSSALAIAALAASQVNPGRMKLFGVIVAFLRVCRVFVAGNARVPRYPLDGGAGDTSRSLSVVMVVAARAC